MKTLKKISIILGCAVALLAGSTVMQAQTLRDADYHNMGRISPNGTVRDANYQSMGYFDKNGNVLDKSNRVVGKVKNLQIYNKDGERIGYINAQGISFEWIACYFFFDFFK